MEDILEVVEVAEEAVGAVVEKAEGEGAVVIIVDELAATNVRNRSHRMVAKTVGWIDLGAMGKHLGLNLHPSLLLCLHHFQKHQ